MNKHYFLFGSEAVEHYEEEGISFLVNLIQHGDFSDFGIFCFSEGDSPTDLLVSFGGWDAFISIEEEDYQQLSNLQESC